MLDHLLRSIDKKTADIFRDILFDIQVKVHDLDISEDEKLKLVGFISRVGFSKVDELEEIIR